MVWVAVMRAVSTVVADTQHYMTFALFMVGEGVVGNVVVIVRY